MDYRAHEVRGSAGAGAGSIMADPNHLYLPVGGGVVTEERNPVSEVQAACMLYFVK